MNGGQGGHRAGALGAGLAAVVFLTVLLNGSFTLLGSGLQSNFYDLQAHALLGGHWDVPVRTLGLEGFHIDGKNYMYFGPFPAVLRMPVAALTHELDGRLSQLSMLLAYGVALLFVVRLVARIRVLVRGDEAVTTAEQVAVAAFVFATGVSVPLFLATQLTVFHEAEIWGIALALGAFDATLGWLARPRGRTLAVASAFATATMMSRPTIGAGTVAVLGLLFLACWTAPTRRLLAVPDEARRAAGWIALAVAVPVVLYAAVNQAKFGTWFGLPFDRQFVTLVSPEHRRVLAANDGSMFGVQFLPTNLLQYLRPDGIEVSRLWPWVRFPGWPTIIGDVTYDRITPTTSVVAAMPVQAVLAVVGLVALASPRRARESAIAALRAPVIGALVGTVPVLIFGFVAQRYLGDFVPFLVLAGAAGLHVTVGWLVRWAQPARTATWVLVGALVVLTVWSGLGLAVLYQRVTTTDPSDLRAFVRSQFTVQRSFPGGAPDLVRVAELPEHAPLGTVAVIGDCAGTFVSNGVGWRALERTPATGGYRLRVTFPAAGTAAAPLLRAGTDAAPMMFWVEPRPGGRAVFHYTRPDGVVVRSRPVDVGTGPHDVDLVLDRRTQEVAVRVDGETVLAATTIPAVRKIVAPLGRVVIGDGGGREPAPGRFPGAIRSVRVAPAMCREITEGV